MGQGFIVQVVKCRKYVGSGKGPQITRCEDETTRPLHGVRLRMELKGGVEGSGMEQTWNGILGRQQTGSWTGRRWPEDDGRRNIIQLIHTSHASGVPGTVLGPRDVTVTTAQRPQFVQGLRRWTLTQPQKGGGRRGKCHNPEQRMRKRRRRC